MGQDGKGGVNATFDPYKKVTRAEFGTLLSRALRGDAYNTTDPDFRKDHLQILNQRGIINNISIYKSNELRGRVMLMLMRTEKMIKEENIKEEKNEENKQDNSEQKAEEQTAEEQTEAKKEDKTEEEGKEEKEVEKAECVSKVNGYKVTSKNIEYKA